MEPQSSKAISIRQSSTLTTLLSSPKTILSKFIKVSPETLENAIEIHKKHFSRLETLLASKRYFNPEIGPIYQPDILIDLNSEIELCVGYLDKYPKLPTIGELSRQNLNNLEVAIKILVNDLRFIISVDNMITDQGIDSLCDLIIAEFPSLTLEDIGICFAQAKKGYFEKLFNRLDGVIIMGWLRQYISEKYERIKERNYVADSHAKIGIGDGRKDFKGNHDQLVRDAYDHLAIQSPKKKKSK